MVTDEMPNVKFHISTRFVGGEVTMVIRKPDDWAEMTFEERDEWCQSEFDAFIANEVEGGWSDTDEPAEW